MAETVPLYVGSQKNQTFYFYNSRFKILILRHSCSKKTISGSNNLQFLFQIQTEYVQFFFVNRLKEVQRKTTILFLYLHLNWLWGKSFTLELSNFSGRSGRARGLIKDNILRKVIPCVFFEIIRGNWGHDLALLSGSSRSAVDVRQSLISHPPSRHTLLCHRELWQTNGIP